MLPSSGQLTLAQVFAEFGLSANSSMSQLYGIGEQIPTSGQLKLSDFYGKAATQPQVNAFLFNNITQANTFMSGYVPPSPLDVFNSWGRFSANDWYPSGTPPAGEAASWLYNSTLGRIESTANTSTYVGFVSPEQLSNYTLEVTVGSDNTDDDLIGVVVAFKRDTTTNQNIWLHAIRGHNNAANKWFLRGFVGTTATAVLAEKNSSIAMAYTNSTYQGWQESGPVRIRIERNGNIIKAYTSQAGSLTIDPATEMVLDLTTVPTLAPLLGAQSYGYICQSQAQAFFSNTLLQGGSNESTVYFYTGSTYYKYTHNGTSWVQTTVDWRSELGYPRDIYNPYTGQTFHIGLDQGITLV